MNHNCMKRHFSNLAGILVFIGHVPIEEFYDWLEASSGGPDSPQTSPRNETVQLSRRQNDCGEFSRAVAVMNMMPNMTKPFKAQ